MKVGFCTQLASQLFVITFGQRPPECGDVDYFGLVRVNQGGVTLFSISSL